MEPHRFEGSASEFLDAISARIRERPWFPVAFSVLEPISSSGNALYMASNDSGQGRKRTHEDAPDESPVSNDVTNEDMEHTSAGWMARDDDSGAWLEVALLIAALAFFAAAVWLFLGL